MKVLRGDSIPFYFGAGTFAQLQALNEKYLGALLGNLQLDSYLLKRVVNRWYDGRTRRNRIYEKMEDGKYRLAIREDGKRTWWEAFVHQGTLKRTWSTAEGVLVPGYREPEFTGPGTTYVRWSFNKCLAEELTENELRAEMQREVHEAFTVRPWTGCSGEYMNEQLVEPREMSRFLMLPIE